MKRLGKEQEVIILGSGLGGMVAGTLLSKHNRSVLLLRERGYQPSYSRQGYHFSPFSNLSEKSIKTSLIKKISRILDLSILIGTREDGVHPKLVSEKSKQKAALQVVLPQSRIDIFPQQSLSAKERKKGFPKEAADIEGFYNELDRIRQLLEKENRKKDSLAIFPFEPRSFIKKIFSSDELSKEKMDRKLKSFSTEFRKFIQLQLLSLGNLNPEQFPLALAAHVLSDESSEAGSDVDLDRLGKEILNQFLRYGGRIEEIDRVKKIHSRWGKGFSLTLEGHPETFESQFLIMNFPLHHSSSLLGEKGGKGLREIKKIEPAYVMVPLFLGIQEKVIPVGMKELLVSILDLEQPYEDGNLLFLSLSPKGDTTKAPAGKRALTVEGLIDFRKWNPSRLPDFQQGVMRHLNHLLPFLDEFTEFVDLQWAGDQASRWTYPSFLYETTSDFYWKEGVVPFRVSKAVYFTGKENFPFLGVKGEIYSGLSVAQQILKKYS